MDAKQPFIHPFFENSLLTEKGLNIQAVFDIRHLPEDIYASLNSACDDLSSYRQLVLIGHGGVSFWKAVSSLVECVNENNHPIDSFSIELVQRFFAEKAPELIYRVLYPGFSLIPLQQLGALAGWHNNSPFKVGVNQVWGSWFAYRACVLTASYWEPSAAVTLPSPCSQCEVSPCITDCPAGAMDDGGFHLGRCIEFRKQEDSPCRQRCLARLACPIGSEHQYSNEQLSYHYSRSLRML